MIKFIVLLSIAITLTACGKIDRGVANLTGYSKSCIDGVSYIQFPSGASVEYEKDGSIKTC